MQRSGLKASMQGSIYWRHAAASSSEEGGASRSGKSKPNEVMPTPPSLTWTFGHLANSPMSFFQPARISCRRRRKGPTPSPPPTWVGSRTRCADTAGRVFLDRFVLVARYPVADAAKAPAANPDLGFQH